MLYEYRVYEVMPGRMADLHRRFREITTRFFDRHGIRVVGFWEAAVGVNNELHYLLAFADMAEREKIWDAFQSDPEWQAARVETERSGPIVARIRNTFLRPTDYSPLP